MVLYGVKLFISSSETIEELKEQLHEQLKILEEYFTLGEETEGKVASPPKEINSTRSLYQNLFSIAENSKLDDGLFDIFILKTQNPVLFFIEFLKILLNIKSNSRIAEYIKAKDFKIKNHYCLAHIDGEITKFTKNLNFGITIASINIYCKKDT